MLRKKSRFEWPKKIYDKTRITEENKLVANYGLKNKKEIWKTEAKIKEFRNHAKKLIGADQEEQQKFFNKLKSYGIEVKTVAEVLALNKEDLLKRRLPSIMVEKKLANTAKQARQMVVHKKVVVGENVVNIPSYIIGFKEESTISIRKKVKKPKVEEKKEEIQETPENTNEEPGQSQEAPKEETNEVKQDE